MNTPVPESQPTREDRIQDREQMRSMAMILDSFSKQAWAYKDKLTNIIRRLIQMVNDNVQQDRGSGRELNIAAEQQAYPQGQQTAVHPAEITVPNREETTRI